jgi:putative transposase
VNECSLPLKRDVEQGTRLVVKQSAKWSWIHRPEEERTLSREGKARLQLLRWHTEHGRNVSLTCRHFGVSRPTFYRWQERYRRVGLRGLEDRSHRPRALRRPRWQLTEIQAVLRLREQYPRWGKRKLQVLLEDEGIHLSCSMIGRMLRHLRRSGQLREGRPQRKRYGRWLPRPYATRKPKEYVAAAPGDLVQVDTLDVRPVAGKTFKHLSLIDVTSRYAVAEVGSGATAATIAAHLDRMRQRLPFAITAIQVDGGSEFKADFEAYCQQHDLRLFVLPPRSPKLNGCVERLQRTFGEEFYQCTDAPPRISDLADDLRRYETIYNTIRPHQALGYRTPAQVLAQQEASA